MKQGWKQEKIIKIDLWEIIDWIFGGKYKCCGFILLETVLFDETHLGTFWHLNFPGQGSKKVQQLGENRIFKYTHYLRVTRRRSQRVSSIVDEAIKVQYPYVQNWLIDSCKWRPIRHHYGQTTIISLISKS